MRTATLLFIILGILLSTNIMMAQSVMPDRVFRDTPKTHNMHIASDGQFLYTCNGGKSAEGQVSKFSLEGELIGSYVIELDMRSIMFNPADKKLYVSTYDRDIYKINDLVMGVYMKVQHFGDRDGQCCPAISPDGKSIYYLEGDSLFNYDLKIGKLKDVLTGFSNAPDALTECTSMAMDSKHIYTWNYLDQIILAYDRKGNFIKSFNVNQGDYLFSLSEANGLIWVSKDGDYDIGTWYGYDLSNKF
jgi:DNA-binding beta-propeller fold protein YncE